MCACFSAHTKSGDYITEHGRLFGLKLLACMSMYNSVIIIVIM